MAFDAVLACRRFEPSIVTDAPPFCACLDLRMRPEHANAIKAPRLPGIGGTMDEDVKLSEAPFPESGTGFQPPRRLRLRKPMAAWLNPEPDEVWACRQSIEIMQEPLNGRMFPGALAG